jgi:general secretion pathway protein I
MKKARGFTLIEILVAMTMFAVVGGALLQLFEGGLRAARQAADYTHAVLLARSKLTELLAYNDLRPGTIEGEFEGGYRWQAVLSAIPQEEPEREPWLNPLDLRLTVAWGEPGDEGSFDLQSICLSEAQVP